MGVVDAREAKQRIAQLPLARSNFFDPVPSNGEIAVDVGRLPCIARRRHETAYSLALRNVSAARHLD